MEHTLKTQLINGFKWDEWKKEEAMDEGGKGQHKHRERGVKNQLSIVDVYEFK